jgi:hypothetical protein
MIMNTVIWQDRLGTNAGTGILATRMVVPFCCVAGWEGLAKGMDSAAQEKNISLQCVPVSCLNTCLDA